MMKTRLALGWWVVISGALAMPLLTPACDSSSASATNAGPTTTGADAATGAASDMGVDTAVPPGTDGATDAPTGSDATAAPTWSEIYSTLLTNPTYPSNCMGGSCHDPGTQKGIDLSTQQSGYLTLRSHLVPGSPQTSQLVGVLQSGKMPEGKPHMPASDVDLVRAWIAAGALDD